MYGCTNNHFQSPSVYVAQNHQKLRDTGKAHKTRVSINSILLLSDRNFCTLNICTYITKIHTYTIVVSAAMPMIRYKRKV